MSCFRPRFSLRTLGVVVTLICAYFGAWEATKRYGVPSGSRWVVSGDSSLSPSGNDYDRVVAAWSPLPLAVVCDETGPFINETRRYYLWLFGAMIKLPYESELMGPLPQNVVPLHNDEHVTIEPFQVNQ
jgi:hypothetical protein